MRCVHYSTYIAGVVVVVCSFTGCAAHYEYVDLQVVDISSGAPIERAYVVATYASPEPGFLRAPVINGKYTDADGECFLRIARVALRISIEKEGYSTVDMGANVDNWLDTGVRDGIVISNVIRLKRH